MIPFARDNMPSGWVFQHDNDPKHTSRYVKGFLEEENIVLKRPAQRPDLKPIEHRWDYVQRQLHVENHTSANNLYAAIERIWYSIPISTCQKLAGSIGIETSPISS